MHGMAEVERGLLPMLATYASEARSCPDLPVLTLRMCLCARIDSF
jgi:hypothetical protein